MDTSPRPVFENPVTGERVVLLTDPRQHPEEALVAHLFVRPGGRVAAPHLHPTIQERFNVRKGQVGFLVGEWEPVEAEDPNPGALAEVTGDGRLRPFGDDSEGGRKDEEG